MVVKGVRVLWGISLLDLLIHIFGSPFFIHTRSNNGNRALLQFIDQILNKSQPLSNILYIINVVYKSIFYLLFIELLWYTYSTNSTEIVVNIRSLGCFN